MAKIDDHDREFSGDVIEQTYPQNYPLVPGHVWLIATDETSSYDVAKALGLVSGGNEDASGVVVPAKGYWGFAHKDLWRLLQPAGSMGDPDTKGLLWRQGLLG